MSIQNFTISIMVNVYNAEKYIEKFLNSLIPYQKQIDELIIVDDGSTDATLNIIQQFSSTYHIKLERMSHLGLSPARAHGLKIASGDIIIVLDVDEIIDDKEIITKFVSPFNDPEVGAVGGTKSPIGSGWLIDAQQLDRNFRHLMRQKDSSEGKYIMGGVFAVRKKALEDVGGTVRDPTIQDDTDLSIRLRKRGWKIIGRDDIVVGHPDPTTLSGVFKKAIRIGIQTIKIIKEHPQEALDFRFFLLYTPLWLGLIAIISWKLALGLIFLSFIFFIVIYSRMPSTMMQRIAAWLLLYINGIGTTIGTIQGLLRR